MRVDRERLDVLSYPVQHLHPTLRHSRDVLGEVREAGVSERSGSPLKLSNLIGWLVVEAPC